MVWKLVDERENGNKTSSKWRKERKIAKIQEKTLTLFLIITCN